MIEILDGAGRVLCGRVVQADRRRVEADVTDVRRVPAPPRVVLAVSVLKGRAMDFLVQKATELGVTEVRPILAERGVVRIRQEEAAGKLDAWRTTAIEACKQCGNPWLPRFLPPGDVAGFLAGPRVGVLLVAALWGEPRLPGEILRERGAACRDGVTLVVGPEGDLSPGEAAALESGGAIPVTLGPLVLRAETAAIAGLAIVQHELRRAAEIQRV